MTFSFTVTNDTAKSTFSPRSNCRGLLWHFWHRWTSGVQSRFARLVSQSRERVVAVSCPSKTLNAQVLLIETFHSLIQSITGSCYRGLLWCIMPQGVPLCSMLGCFHSTLFRICICTKICLLVIVIWVMGWLYGTLERCSAVWRKAICMPWTHGCGAWLRVLMGVAALSEHVLSTLSGHQGSWLSDTSFFCPWDYLASRPIVDLQNALKGIFSGTQTLFKWVFLMVNMKHPVVCLVWSQLQLWCICTR